MNIPIIVESANLIGNRKAKIATLQGTDWQVSGNDAQKLREELVSRLAKQGHFNRTRKYIVAGDATFCLYYADGWQYDIVRKDNASCPSACLLNCQTYTEALGHTTRHAEQYAEPAVAA